MLSCLTCFVDISQLEIRTGFRTKRKFCSQSCSAKFNNPRRKRPIPCEFCENPIKRRPSRFCSIQCHKAQIKKTTIDTWLAGDKASALTIGKELKEAIRQYLLEQANRTCELCGWNKINPALGYSPVEIDHIDGNWLNASRENLRVVCPNCHALQSTYKALNVGNNKAVGANYFYKRKLEALKSPALSG